jgi:hypothetical protein
MKENKKYRLILSFGLIIALLVSLNTCFGRRYALKSFTGRKNLYTLVKTELHGNPDFNLPYNLASEKHSNNLPLLLQGGG